MSIIVTLAISAALIAVKGSRETNLFGFARVGGGTGRFVPRPRAKENLSGAHYGCRAGRKLTNKRNYE
jgi:hypothetical protein